MQNIAPQENSSEVSSQGNNSMQHFRDAIKELKAKELDITETVHFEGINPELLTEQDQEMWDMVEGVIASGTSVETIMPRFEEYRNGVENETSRLFAGFLANKLMPIRNAEFIAKQKKYIFE